MREVSIWLRPRSNFTLLQVQRICTGCCERGELVPPHPWLTFLLLSWDPVATGWPDPGAICPKETTTKRDCQVGKSQATPPKSNPQTSVTGGNEPAGLSWDPAACPVLLSPTLLLEFPLLSARCGAVCGRCLVAVGHGEASGCSGGAWGDWPSLAHRPGTSGNAQVTQLQLQPQPAE